MRELTAGPRTIARVRLVAGRSKVVKAAQQLELVFWHELDYLDERTRRGPVLTALQVTRRAPEDGSDAGLGRRPVDLLLVHSGAG